MKSQKTYDYQNKSILSPPEKHYRTKAKHLDHTQQNQGAIFLGMVPAGDHQYGLFLRLHRQLSQMGC